MHDASSKRTRGVRRAPASLKRALVRRAAAARVGAALQTCTDDERGVLALLLLERLTPAEAARALGIGIDRVARLKSSLIARLRRAVQKRAVRPVRTGVRAIIVPMPRVKEA